MADQLSKNERIKLQTLELYDSLPQDKAQRIARTDVRDKIIDLNYTFFGYIASQTFIANSTVTYEDKFQSALLHFCECWWWYKWQGDETHGPYRSDLSFSVFFLPRIKEMIDRELVEVKYSIRRTLCMEAGAQLNKHWSKVTYDDLKHVNLPANKIASLKAIFGAIYPADLSEHELYIPSTPDIKVDGQFDSVSEEYDTIEDLLIHDMIILEKPLDDKELKKMSDMYQIDLYDLKEALPRAEAVLHERLKRSLDTRWDY